MADDVSVHVVVAESYLQHLDGVVSGLRAAGLRDISVLKEVGLIQGVARADALAALEQIAGVAAVERSREVHVPPIDSEP